MPIDLLFAAAGHVGAVALLEKLLLLASIFLAGLGMHRLAPTDDEVGRYFAGLLYAVNPFVYDRLYTGQWYLVLGYALLPWAFRAFQPLARGEWRRAWRFALLATLVGVASPHMLALLVLLALFSAGAELVRHRRPATLGAAMLGLGLTVLGSLYWLLPRAGVEDLWRHVTPAQLALYQTVSDHTWGILANVAGLYGYWNDADPIKAHLATWPLLALGLAALAGLGLVARRRDTAAWAVAAGAGAGFVLALGGRGPLTGGLFTSLLGHVAAARSFREPEKGVALVVFGYAYLGAPAVAALRQHWPQVRSRSAAGLAAALIALPLLYGYRELGGLWGSMSTSSYPASWTEARSVLEREASSSNTLFLPWHGYLALSFAHGRVVSNPAPSFFGTPVLASRSVGEGAAAADNSDPRDAAIAALLARGAQLSSLGACLATLGVSHVLVADDADAARYSFLTRQSDLVVERRWSDLVLYRNTHPTGLVLAATGSVRGACSTHCSARRGDGRLSGRDPARAAGGKGRDRACRPVVPARLAARRDARCTRTGRKLALRLGWALDRHLAGRLAPRPPRISRSALRPSFSLRSALRSAAVGSVVAGQLPSTRRPPGAASLSSSRPTTRSRTCARWWRRCLRSSSDRA